MQAGIFSLLIQPIRRVGCDTLTAPWRSYAIFQILSRPGALSQQLSAKRCSKDLISLVYPNDTIGLSEPLLLLRS